MATMTELRDDVVSHQFSPTQYNEYTVDRLNQAQRYICAQTDFPEIRATQTDALVAGQADYTQPSDFNRLNTLSRLDDDGNHNTLIRQAPQVFDTFSVSSGVPTNYKIEGGVCYLWPTPAAASGSLFWDYMLEPTTLALADTPIIPEQYQYLMVHYALKFCFERENDYNSAQYHWGQFNEGIMKCRGEVHHETNDNGQPRILGEDQTKALLVEGF